VERLYRERYQGFTVKHFHEHLVRTMASAGTTPGRSCIFSGMGVVAKAPGKGAHRRKRERPGDAAASGRLSFPGVRRWI
jgi:hypothetical protein